MGILDFFKGRSRPVSPEVRTLPETTQIDLADHEVHQEYFVWIRQWSTITPTVPAWQLPDAEEQRRWVEELVGAHAQAGDLDGLVPDLLDRLIHDKLDEVRTEIDGAHQVAQFHYRLLFEQGKRAQVQLAETLAGVRRQLRNAESGYAVAHEALTGRKPVDDVTPTSVMPVLIPTQTAPGGPISEGPGDPFLDEPGPEEVADESWSATTALNGFTSSGCSRKE